MLKLITLELKKNKIRSYIYAIGIITLCMLGFLYTFGMIAYLGGNADAIEFSTYSNIWTLTTALHTVSYVVLMAVMFSTFIIKEYTSKITTVLFTYPIDRAYLINAKIILIAIIGMGGMLLGTIISLTIFSATEMLFSLVPDIYTLNTIINILLETILCAVYSLFISIISLRIGFQKKSVQITIVSAIILASCSANIISTMSYSRIPFSITWIVIAIIAIVCYIGFIGKVRELEI